MASLGGAGDILSYPLHFFGGSIFTLLAVGAAILLLLLMYYLAVKTPSRAVSSEKRYVKLATLKPPKAYDLLVYVVDDSDSTITREGFVKISDRLYVSTTLPTPSFLYVPEKSKIYMCREKKGVVPCALGYRRNLMTILADAELAATQELLDDSSAIKISHDDLSKLLASLYKDGMEKTGYISVSPNTKIAVRFNMERITRAFLDVLRSADEMLIHFLNTASQAESIERFMKAAARMHEARLSWLRWVLLLIIGAAIAWAIINMVSTGAHAPPH